MTFKFQNNKVTVIRGILTCDDKLTRDLLLPLLEIASGPPEAGHPFLNLIADIYGADSIKDVEYESNHRIFIN